MLNSDYKIVSLSGGQLEIIASRDVMFALLFIGLGLIPTVFFTYRMFKSGSLFPGWAILMFGAPFILVGCLSLRTGTLTLDKNTDTASFHEPKRFSHSDTVVPLHSLQYATIRTMRASSYIAVVLESGDSLTFAASTQQGGKGRAVEAINRYIGAKVH